jgi:hypothetical protein
MLPLLTGLLGMAPAFEQQTRGRFLANGQFHYPGMSRTKGRRSGNTHTPPGTEPKRLPQQQIGARKYLRKGAWGA